MKKQTQLRRTATLSLLSLAIASTCHAGDAIGIFARAKDASGGARWDAVKSWRGDGTASTGGMSGAFHVTVDARNGRSADAYTIGSMEGADGFDGAHSWQRDPGGEVASLDAPAAIRRARNDAWISAHGYWYPKAMPAAWGEMSSKTDGGKRYDVVVATPQGGDPLTLWFDGDSGLLARVQEPQGSSMATTVYDDYRLVDGVRVPFHATVDVTDAAGRTDPRDHSEVRFEHVAFNVAVSDADFAMPKMEATARIDNTAGATTIPFDLVNNHIYVDGSVDGKPARFLVDTGGTNLLTPAAAKRLGLTGEGKLAARGVGDEAVDLALAHAKEVRVGDAVLEKPVFYVLDLGDRPKVEGVEADGKPGSNAAQPAATAAAASFASTSINANLRSGSGGLNTTTRPFVVIVHPAGIVKVVPAGVLPCVPASMCCAPLAGESGAVDAGSAIADAEQAHRVSIQPTSRLRMKTVSAPWMTQPIRGCAGNLGNRVTGRFGPTIQ